MSAVVNFLAGFAVGVLAVFGMLGLGAAICLAWARDSAARWLNG
jgi:hypothetical protein